MPSIKYFKDFLPNKLTSIPNTNLMTNSIQQNMTAHKLALVFNFPPMKVAGKDVIQEKARKCYVIPFFNENEVQLAKPSQTQILWLNHVCIIEDRLQLKSLFSKGIKNWEKYFRATVVKFNTTKWRLQTFDVAGICKRKLNLKNMTIKLFED